MTVIYIGSYIMKVFHTYTDFNQIINIMSSSHASNIFAPWCNVFHVCNWAYRVGSNIVVFMKIHDITVSLGTWWWTVFERMFYLMTSMQINRILSAIGQIIDVIVFCSEMPIVKPKGFAVDLHILCHLTRILTVMNGEINDESVAGSWIHDSREFTNLLNTSYCLHE